MCCGKGEKIKWKKKEHEAIKTFHNISIFLEYKNVQASNPETNSSLWASQYILTNLKREHKLLGPSKVFGRFATPGFPVDKAQWTNTRLKHKLSFP